MIFLLFYVAIFAIFVDAINSYNTISMYKYQFAFAPGIKFASIETELDNIKKP